MEKQSGTRYECFPCSNSTVEERHSFDTYTTCGICGEESDCAIFFYTDDSESAPQEVSQALAELFKSLLKEDK